MDGDLPPLLRHLDVTTLAWSALWSLLLGLSQINRTRREQARVPGAPLTSWWTAVIDGLLGSLIGGVLAALAIPTWVPEWREPGRIALLSVAGAAIGPYLATFTVQAFRQVVAWLSERKIGVRIELKEPGGRHDDPTEP